MHYSQNLLVLSTIALFYESHVNYVSTATSISANMLHVYN